MFFQFLKKISGTYNSISSEFNIFLVFFDPSNEEKIIEASTITFSFIYYFNLEYNFLYLSCNDLLTFLPNIIDSSFILSSSSFSSCISASSESSLINLFKANLNSAFDSSGISIFIKISTINTFNHHNYINISLYLKFGSGKKIWTNLCLNME